MCGFKYLKENGLVYSRDVMGRFMAVDQLKHLSMYRHCVHVADNRYGTNNLLQFSKKCQLNFVTFLFSLEFL